MDHQTFAQILGNYGEFFGAIAVVATLAYLAAQVRHNTTAQQANSQHIVSEGFNRANLLLVQDRELLNVMRRGNEGFSALNEEEAIVFLNYTVAFLRIYEEAYADHLRGVLEEEYWKSREGNLKAYVAMPGFQQFWTAPAPGPFMRNSSETFRPDFVELLAGLMREGRTRAAE